MMHRICLFTMAKHLTLASEKFPVDEGRNDIPIRQTRIGQTGRTQ
jgi:hypothetical protein